MTAEPRKPGDEPECVCRDKPGSLAPNGVLVRGHEIHCPAALWNRSASDDTRRAA
jgi:hypothetical protein